MGKHSQKKNTIIRTSAIMATVGAGAAILNPAIADAQPVTVPNTNVTFDVPAELAPQVVPLINSIPGVPADLQGAMPAAPAPAPGAPALPAPASSTGQHIADIALSKVGAPYAWGAAGPDAFDCSGLTSWSYSQAGKSIPRTSDAQAASGAQVSVESLQPGDIISYYSGASHVAIYIGGGKIVHALNEGEPVRVDDMNYMPINNAVRF
ncbi:C40 family peptidase [Corynebacterium heidelbergense]|uniref:Endopeptidase n=1 Tax=Corynebacterium heidelbergense TaxID=2055947 RepID=A0A364VD63_9CORY|nr:C40 family peptidase [Corynebacterium heidelbergense]RAV34577.1 endopeptidase [Corynebacterium heidelbergense]WCZ36343.1 putative endopeptidase precursor [Corynebacterium heidelbergense]